MPPTRTFPAVKPVKTERTHEENQERAYIAASRRSDRSLEARVESARRASEIHKRRTGRSLRVTEQDVINEEMYEEEDDDLPSQYRRLTAHLQTGSHDFNRRLAAYLTNSVALRTALNEAVHGNFSSHYPNAPHFAHNNSMPNNNGMFSSPMGNQGFVQQQQQQQTMQSPTDISPRTPHPYRHAPYPMPGQSQYRPNQQQQRAMSIQLPPQGMSMPVGPSPVPSMSGGQGSQYLQQSPEAFRRASMPVVKQTSEVEQLPSPQSDTSPRLLSPSDEHPPTNKPGSAPASVTNVPIGQTLLSQPQHSSPLQHPQPQHPQLFQRQARPNSISLPNNNFTAFHQSQSRNQSQIPSNPLTMSLPPNEQQIIDPAAILSSSFGDELMGGPASGMFSLPSGGFGASDAGSMLKPGAHFHPNVHGMNSTLAPEDLWQQPNMATGTAGNTYDSTNSPNFDNFFNFNGDGHSSVNTPQAGGPDVSGSFSEFVDASWNESGT